MRLTKTQFNLLTSTLRERMDNLYYTEVASKGGQAKTPAEMEKMYNVISELEELVQAISRKGFGDADG